MNQLIALMICLLCGTFAVTVLGAPQSTTLSRPRYIGCQSSNECGLGNCCVIGMWRFSIPSCQSVEEINGSCKPFENDPFNATVSYPDGAAVPLTNVYRMFCPCAPSLACDLETNTCQDQAHADNIIYNTVLV